MYSHKCTHINKLSRLLQLLPTAGLRQGFGVLNYDFSMIQSATACTYSKNTKGLGCAGGFQCWVWLVQ